MTAHKNLHNRLLQFATVGNHNRRKGLVAVVGAGSLNGTNDVHSLNHLSEHDVLSIQMRSGNLGEHIAEQSTVVIKN